MNYHQLQSALKTLRDCGHVARSFKLNQRREILQAEFDRVKAIAMSKIIPTPQPAPQQPQTEPAPAPKPEPETRQAATNFAPLIKEFDNYIPAYKLAELLGNLNPTKFWKWAYDQTRSGLIELSTLQEGFHYTPDQLRYQARGYCNWFFISFNQA